MVAGVRQSPLEEPLKPRTENGEPVLEESKDSHFTQKEEPLRYLNQQSLLVSGNLNEWVWSKEAVTSTFIFGEENSWPFKWVVVYQSMSPTWEENLHFYFFFEIWICEKITNSKTFLLLIFPLCVFVCVYTHTWRKKEGIGKVIKQVLDFHWKHLLLGSGLFHFASLLSTVSSFKKKSYTSCMAFYESKM